MAGLSTKVLDFFGFNKVDGELGLEVEVEGENLPGGPRPYWEGKPDHSLRGEAVEYVFRRPYNRAAVPEALTKLELALTAPDVRVKDSRRTSVHVHRNVQQFTLRQVYNLIALYYIFEIPMTEFAGPSRVGNMYCLRGFDAEFLPFEVVRSLQTGQYLRMFAHRDDVRYSGLNLCAVCQFGSAEFRAFRGTIRTDEILPWVDVIEALAAEAQRFKDPQEISAEFFSAGPTKFLEAIMPKPFVEHVKTFTDYEDTMIVGHQYTFEIAHALDDWHGEEVEQEQVKHPWHNEPAVPARRRRQQEQEDILMRMVNFQQIPNVLQPVPAPRMNWVDAVAEADEPVFHDDDDFDVEAARI